MKTILILAAAGVMLSGCGVLTGRSDLLGVNPEATPAAQKVKAEADAKLTAALAARLEHCTILGNLDLTAELSPAAGAKAGAGINCPPKPWDERSSDDELVAKAVAASQAAISKLLDARFGPTPQ